MSRNRKTVAAITIPSDQNFTVIATAIFNGERGVATARDEALAIVNKAGATSLTLVRDALKGFPAITEDMWKETYAPGLRAAFAKLYPNPDSAKSVLTRWKRAILAITAGHAVQDGETLHAYLTRLYPPKETGKGRGGAEKTGETGERAPQQPKAPSWDDADTAEEMFANACTWLASVLSEPEEQELAAALQEVLADETGARALLAWHKARKANATNAVPPRRRAA